MKATMGDNIHNHSMGFRRPARVVFLSGRPDGLAAEALALSQEMAAGWMEVRAAVLPGCAGPVAVLDGDDLVWGDLLVTLDAAALAGMPQRRAGMQHRHYPFEPDEQDMAGVLARLRERIAGMTGGLRMLHKAAQVDEEP